MLSNILALTLRWLMFFPETGRARSIWYLRFYFEMYLSVSYKIYVHYKFSWSSLLLDFHEICTTKKTMLKKTAIYYSFQCKSFVNTCYLYEVKWFHNCWMKIWINSVFDGFISFKLDQKQNHDTCFWKMCVCIWIQFCITNNTTTKNKKMSRWSSVYRQQ